MILVLAILVILGGDPQQPIRSTIHADTLDVTGWGVIQAEQDVVISAEVSGRVVAVGAAVGDEIDAGTVLVRFDEEVLLAQSAQARTVIEAAEANLAIVRASRPQAEIEAARAAVDATRFQAAVARDDISAARAKLRAAQASYRAAQARLARLLSGPSERDLELARLWAELARNQLWEMQARRDATRSSVDDPLEVPLLIGEFDFGSLVIANPVAPRQWDVGKAERTVSAAESAVTVAGVEYEKLKAGPDSSDLAIMQARVAQARARQDSAEEQLYQAQQVARVSKARVRQLEAQLGRAMAPPKVESVAVAQAELERARAEAAILDARRDKLTLLSPVAGLVTERTVHEGEVFLLGARLFAISDLNPVIHTIYVPENQIGLVHLGQQADVRVDAYPDRVFQGEVTHIASRAEFTPRNIQTREERTTIVFAVRITLPNPDVLLKPGMPAQATLR